MRYLLLIIVISGGVFHGIADDSTGVEDSKPYQGYRIDQPGTITFTVGVKIKGNVEKPQVLIFLPKEKTIYRELPFSYSFRDDILKPLPFAPIVE